MQRLVDSEGIIGFTAAMSVVEETPMVLRCAALHTLHYPGTSTLLR